MTGLRLSLTHRDELQLLGRVFSTQQLVQQDFFQDLALLVARVNFAECSEYHVG
jgi:hypothetical protein